MNKEQVMSHLKAVRRTSLNDTVIHTHHDNRMKESYHFIYRLLKTIKSFPVKPDYTQDLKDYFQMIDSNKDFPLFLQKQMKRLIQKRIRLIKDKNAPKKWFEFNLIVPKHAWSWCKEFSVSNGYYRKHILYDSRNIFIHLGRKKNG